MTNQKTIVRVRFAPSPTGELHIGSLRTALYNWLFARQRAGSFILRIEDTDQTRIVAGAETRLINTLKQFGLDYDEGPDIGGGVGPYRQSERLEMYKQYAEELIRIGKAYYCTCTADRLAKMRTEQQGRGEAPRYDGHCRDRFAKRPAGECVIRYRMPADGNLVVTDIIRREVSFANATLDDFVLLKSDLFPTYHLASVVDDHLMGMTQVIRAEEWLPSLPRHIHLYQAFGWKPPQFAHLPLILGKDREKLSKRHGAVSAQALLTEGYLPEVIINFIALLGWHSKSDREIMTLAEMKQEFSLERVQKAGAVFNQEKMDWMNAKMIRTMPVRELVDRAMVFCQGRIAEKHLVKLETALALVRDRVKKLNELPELMSFLVDDFTINKALLKYRSSTDEESSQALEYALKLINEYNKSWEVDAMEKWWQERIKQDGCQPGNILWPLRVALTGKKASPPTFNIMHYLGKEESENRIKNALK